MNLLFAPLGAGVVLVEAGEIAIVALVQRLILDSFEALLTDFIKDDVKRVLGARQRRGEGDVVLDAIIGQSLTAGLGLFDAKLGQVGVLPAGKEILQIPVALPVANENESTAHKISP